jgi:ABC-2 type transport system permease protein
MKFREIFRFELAYQIRRVSTWVYFAALFGFGFLIMRAGTPEEGVFLNSPNFVAFFTVMGGVIWLLLAGSVAGDAAARDVETRMDPLTYTAPVSKTDYLGGRFLAAFTLNAAMLLALQAGILLSLLLPRSRPELIGPYQPAGHLTVYFLIALPNALVATAIQFAAALRQRRAIAGYLASVLLLVLHLVGTTGAQLFRLWELAKLIDLIGFVNVLLEMEELTPLESNTRLIVLEGMFLVNRVVWIGIALGVLAFTHRRFQFGHPFD